MRLSREFLFVAINSILICFYNSPSFVSEAHADATKKPPSCSSQTGGSSDSLMASTNGLYECAYTAGLDNKKIGAWQTQTWTSNTAKGYKKQYNCHGQSGGVSIDDMYESTDLGSSITYWAYNTQDGSRHWGAGVLWQTQANGGVAGDQYIHNCNGNHGDIRSNKMYITITNIVSYPGKVDIGTPATVNVSVTAPYGNSPPQGKVYLYQQKNSSGTQYADPKTDWIIGAGTLDSNGNSTIITGFAGQDPQGGQVYPKPSTVLIYSVMANNPDVQKDPAPTPPNKGWVASQSDSYQVKLVQKYTTTGEASVEDSIAYPENSIIAATNRANVFDLDNALLRPSSFDSSINGGLTNNQVNDLGIVVQNVIGDGRAPLYSICPKGMKPLNIEGWSERSSISENAIKYVKANGLFGAQIRLPIDQSNDIVQLQVICRNAKAGIAQAGRIQYGTPRADHLSSNEDGSILFGGLDDDVFRLNNNQSMALGGEGNDRFILSANNSVANGGAGKDRIEVIGSGEALIIGGPGRDVLIGGSGLTRINMLDGEGGDKAICGSPDNQVMADEGDIIVGPCVRVFPDDTQY